MSKVVQRCSTNMSSSTNEPGSNSRSSRSRAVSLPASCCFCTRSGPPAAKTVRCFSSSCAINSSMVRCGMDSSSSTMPGARRGGRGQTPRSGPALGSLRLPEHRPHPGAVSSRTWRRYDGPPRRPRHLYTCRRRSGIRAPMFSNTAGAREGGRDFLAVSTAQFSIAFALNFMFVFLPFYIRSVSPMDEAATLRWTGLILGAASATATFGSAFWGGLSDRYSPKALFERGLISHAILVVLMAFTTDVRFLLAIRIVQGFLGGISTIGLIIVSAVSVGGTVAPPPGNVSIGPDAGADLRPAPGGGGRGAVGVPRGVPCLGGHPLRHLSLLASRPDAHSAPPANAGGDAVPRRQVLAAWGVSLVATMHIVFLPSILPAILRGFRDSRAPAPRHRGRHRVCVRAGLGRRIVRMEPIGRPLSRRSPDPARRRRRLGLSAPAGAWHGRHDLHRDPDGPDRMRRRDLPARPRRDGGSQPGQHHRRHQHGPLRGHGARAGHGDLHPRPRATCSPSTWSWPSRSPWLPPGVAWAGGPGKRARDSEHGGSIQGRPVATRPESEAALHRCADAVSVVFVRSLRYTDCEIFGPSPAPAS